MEQKNLSLGEKIVAQARGQIGYNESPVNRTKFGEWFGLDGKSWCAIFVSWCYAQAGKPITGGGFARGFAGTQTGLKVFTEKGWRTHHPAPGDIVIFDFDGNGSPEHTGIFEKWIVEGNTFQTIEGNTAPKNDKNGGKVMERQRENKNVYFFHIP